MSTLPGQTDLHSTPQNAQEHRAEEEEEAAGSVATSPRAGKEGNNPEHVASLPREGKKNTARTRQAQRRSSAEWLPRWACAVSGSQTPCRQSPVRVCCCSVTVGGQQPRSGTAHVALMVEKRLPAHLPRSTRQTL